MKLIESNKNNLIDIVLINPHKKSNTRYLYGMIFNAAAVILYAFTLKLYAYMLSIKGRQCIYRRSCDGGTIYNNKRHLYCSN